MPTTEKKFNKKKRRRRAPDDARENILAAAEALLIEGGPQLLKVTEVARRAGVAAATIMHHFESIEGVHAALMDRMVAALGERVAKITAEAPAPMDAALASTQVLFDAFEAPGAARLAAWLVMTGEVARLSTVGAAVDRTVEMDLMYAPDGVTRADLRAMAMGSIVSAMGAGLFGAALAELLGEDKATPREAAIAAQIAYVAQTMTLTRPRQPAPPKKSRAGKSSRR